MSYISYPVLYPFQSLLAPITDVSIMFQLQRHAIYDSCSPS